MIGLMVMLALGRCALGAPTTTPAAPGLDLKMVTDVLAELRSIPVAEAEEDSVPPELMDLYHNVNMLWEAQNSNLTETRDGRGLLSKLSFLTGLKLGSILTGSGTLAASQSINFLGKVLNAALSVSYGSLGNYGGVGGGGLGGGGLGGYFTPGVAGGGAPTVVGVQKLPIIQEDVPEDDKKREKPDDPFDPQSSAPTLTVTSSPLSAEGLRQAFLKNHNQRVESFNNVFGKKKTNARTGRIDRPKFDKIT